MPSGLGGLNKSPNGVVIGLAQLALPDPHTRAELWTETQRVIEMIGKARRPEPMNRHIGFPEYSLHGLSMVATATLLCSRTVPEVRPRQQCCTDATLWACES